MKQRSTRRTFTHALSGLALVLTLALAGAVGAQEPGPRLDDTGARAGRAGVARHARLEPATAERLTREMVLASRMVLEQFDLGRPSVQQSLFNQLEQIEARLSTLTDGEAEALAAMGPYLEDLHNSSMLMGHVLWPSEDEVAPAGEAPAQAKSAGFPPLRTDVPEYPTFANRPREVAVLARAYDTWFNPNAETGRLHDRSESRLVGCNIGLNAQGRANRRSANSMMQLILNTYADKIGNDFANNICGGASIDAVVISFGYSCDLCCIITDYLFGMVELVYQSVEMCEDLIDSAEIEAAHHEALAAAKRIGHVHDDVTTVQATVSTNQTKINAVQATANTISTKVDGVQATANTNQTKIDGVQATANTISTKIDGVQATANTNQTKIDGVQATANTVETKVDGVQSTANTIETKVDGVQSTADTISTQVAGVQSTADSIEVKVDDLDVDLASHDAGVHAELDALESDLDLHHEHLDRDLAEHDAALAAHEETLIGHDENLAEHDELMDAQHQEILRRLRNDRTRIEVALRSGDSPPVFALPAGPDADPASLPDNVVCDGLTPAGLAPLHEDGLFEQVRCIVRGNIDLFGLAGYSTGVAENHFQDGEAEWQGDLPDYRAAVRHYQQAVASLMTGGSPPR